MQTDVLACRLPAAEAALFRTYAQELGVPVSQAIRDALNREVRTALAAGAALRAAA